MSTHIGIGFSQNPDSFMAAQEAAKMAKEQLKQPRIDLAIVLNTVHYDPGVALPAIYESLDQTKIIGCSTAAIFLEGAIENHGLLVVAIYSEKIKFETGHISHLNLQDMHAAGTHVMVRGEGVYLSDARGQKLLDGLAGLWCVNVG